MSNIEKIIMLSKEIIEALEKQIIAKKPIVTKTKDAIPITYVRCPICNIRVGDNANPEGCITGVDHCSRCGQLIDWSEVENE